MFVILFISEPKQTKWTLLFIPLLDKSLIFSPEIKKQQQFTSTTERCNYLHDTNFVFHTSIRKVFHDKSLTWPYLPTSKTTKKEKSERKWKSTSFKLKDTIMKVKTIWKLSKLRLMRYNRWSTQILQIMHDLAFYNYN